MVDTTGIEKKSLEAHVELCAERYRFLEEKLDTVERNVTDLTDMVSQVRDLLRQVTEKRNDQVLNWSIGLITLMTGIIGYLLASFVFK